MFGSDVNVPLDGGDDSVVVVFIEETGWGCLGSGLGLNLGLLNSSLLLLELLALELELLLFLLELLLISLDLLSLVCLVDGLCFQLGLVCLLGLGLLSLGLGLALELALVWHRLVLTGKSCNWRIVWR